MRLYQHQILTEWEGLGVDDESSGGGRGAKKKIRLEGRKKKKEKICPMGQPKKYVNLRFPHRNDAKIAILTLLDVHYTPLQGGLDGGVPIPGPS